MSASPCLASSLLCLSGVTQQVHLSDRVGGTASVAGLCFETIGACGWRADYFCSLSGVVYLLDEAAGPTRPAGTF